MSSQIDITVAATKTRLTTLSRVKAELGISSEDFDGIIGDAIDAQSLVIGGLVLPSLRRETLVETMRPDVDRYGCVETISGPWLKLTRYPIVSIASIVLDGGAAMQSGDYYHSDAGVPIPTGLVGRLSGGVPTSWSFTTSAVITYTAGYLLPEDDDRDLPADIEKACVDLVKATYFASRRDSGVRSERTEGIDAVTYFSPADGAFPATVAAALARYGYQQPGVF